MRELFIYYRVQVIDAVLALAEVRAFQGRLAESFPRLEPRLLRRPDEVDGLQTWMETYAVDALQSPAGVTPEIEAEIEYTFRKNGAMGVAYPSIVATGSNACVLHYIENNSILKDGDLLLIDFLKDRPHDRCALPRYRADLQHPSQLAMVEPCWQESGL